MTSSGRVRRQPSAIPRGGGVAFTLLGLLKVTVTWTGLTARQWGLIAGWQVPL